MRYKATFIAGVAVGFIVGARAGRDKYDQLMRYGRQIAAHPKVQQATSTVQAKATELTRTAAAKAPDYAKNAATNAAKTASTQVPKLVSTARQAAADKIPARFGGARGASSTGADADADTAPANPATDGAPGGGPDDVAADGNLVYPADGGSPSVNGIRYTPDTPDTPATS
jgi:hypothetical protein